MNQEEALSILKKVGAFRSGHFVFTSGRHSDTYVNKDALYPHTHETSSLCREKAMAFSDAGVEAVIGPAVAAAILAQWTAYHLSDLTGHEVFAAYADKDTSGGFLIKRGYDRVLAGRRTLVVEDLTTTGGSIKKVIDAARAAGAEIVGASVLFNRGAVRKEDIGDPPRLFSLIDMHIASWDAGECELCRQGVPVNVDVGHGLAFLNKHKHAET